MKVWAFASDAASRLFASSRASLAEASFPLEFKSWVLACSSAGLVIEIVAPCGKPLLEQIGLVVENLLPDGHHALQGLRFLLQIGNLDISLLYPRLQGAVLGVPLIHARIQYGLLLGSEVHAAEPEGRAALL